LWAIAKVRQFSPEEIMSFERGQAVARVGGIGTRST
jgi:hypothetical protein